MSKFAYRPVGIAVLIFLVVSLADNTFLSTSLVLTSGTILFDQVAMLYNSQLYFRPRPQPLEAQTDVHEDLKVSEPKIPEGTTVEEGAANAVMLMLARNSELEGAVSSVKQLEEKFNQRYHYPWVFLNEEPFTDEFKQWVCFGYF